MKQKTLNLMEEAISSAGRWTWIELADDSIQLEFDEVQLYKHTLEKYSKHSSEIAIRLADNTFFTIFYNINEDIKFSSLKNDFSYKISENGLKFQDFDIFKKINNNYNFKKTLIGEYSFDIKNRAFDFLLTVIFENIAIVCGANQLNFFNDFESLNDEDIKKLSNQWWIYWIDYWKSKKTYNQYEYDLACESIVFNYSN